VEFREGYDWKFLPIDDHSNLRELVIVVRILTISCHITPLIPHDLQPGPEDSPAAINHENPRGFATNDIWVPHPTKPNMWKYHSRAGDVVRISAHSLMVAELIFLDLLDCAQ